MRTLYRLFLFLIFSAPLAAVQETQELTAEEAHEAFAYRLHPAPTTILKSIKNC